MTKCVFIGEAWGEEEAKYESPFVGTAGQELARILSKSGFPIESPQNKYCSPLTMMSKWKKFPYPLLNVFNQRPSYNSNNIQLLYAKPRDGIPIDKTLPERAFNNTIHYVRADKAHHVHKLHSDLQLLSPNLIITLGATACWALGLGEQIGKLRGFVHETSYGKVFPTYHPAAILYKWKLRAPTLLDLAKARREMASPKINNSYREIWTEPTITDLWQWWHIYGSKSDLLAIDIETIRRSQISEVGFASDPNHALHIPFCWEEKDNNHKKIYRGWWPSIDEEVQAWKFVKHVCESPIPKIGQNLKYDVYWLAKEMGIAICNWQHDTMVAAHCWQPELGKSLYDLGSYFLDNELSWKSIRKESQKDKDND